MAQITSTLIKGITIGDTEYKTAVLRDATALDVIEATAASEKVVMVPAGITAHGTPKMEPQLIASPTLVGINVLRRQIVSIGPFEAPIDDVVFAKLSPEDLNVLQRDALSLERASLEVAQRGRTDGAGGDSA